jgi:hypothetical protein
MDRIRVLREDAANEIMYAQAAVTESEHPARLCVRGPAAVTPMPGLFEDDRAEIRPERSFGWEH